MENRLLEYIKGNTVKIIGVSILTAVIGTGTYLCAETHLNKDKVYKGVYVDNIDVSHLTKEQLHSKLEEHFNSKINGTDFTFEYENFKEKIKARDVGAFYDIDEITDNTFNTGKGSNVFKNTFDRLSISANNNRLSFPMKADVAKLNKYMDHVSLSLNRKKAPSAVAFNGDAISYVKNANGVTVNKTKLNESVIQYLNSKDSSDHSFDIPVTKDLAAVSADTVKKMTVLGSFSTKLPDLYSGRTKNIKLFIGKLNTTVVMPGQIFSADKTGGSRTMKDGYTYAKGYVKGRVVDIVAGGICQAVTTTYNAVLYSDLKIVERKPHMFPVTYAALGRDATIASGSVDFKFKNNMKNPVIIQEYVTSDGYVKVNIWGVNENPDKKIVIDAKKTGYNSSITYKYVFVKDKLIKSEIISKDKYSSHP